MTSWSFSHYSLALQCLRKYKYVCVDKIIPDVPERGDLVFGSALHSAINACLTGEDGPSTFEIYWSSYQDKEIEYGRYGWKELAKLGAEFMRKFAKYHAPKYEFILGEKRLYAKYKSVNLEGSPDALTKYNGEITLADWKTSGYNYPQEKTTSMQLNLYAFLLLENGYSVENLQYLVFNKGTGSIQNLTWKFSKDKMLEYLDSMADYCYDFQNRLTFPKNINACLNFNRPCEFYEICESKPQESS